MLQAAPQPITLAQVFEVAVGLGAFGTLIGFAFKMGGLNQRVGTFEEKIEPKIDAFISASTANRVEWTGWRSEVDMQRDAHSKELENHRKRLHDLAGDIQNVETRVTVIEQTKPKGAA